MIRFTQNTFVRHAGGQSLLWRPQTGACVVVDGAEPFLKHIGWTLRPEAEIVAEIAADFGMKTEEIAGDFQEFVAPLIADGFLTQSTRSPSHAENAECAEEGFGRDAPTARPQEDGRFVETSLPEDAPSSANFDVDGNTHDESWTPLGDFCKENGIPTELHLDLTAACTERCVHCYLPDYPVKHIPFELAEKALREFRDMQGLTVHLTGGECMLHPDFERVCRFCRDGHA